MRRQVFQGVPGRQPGTLAAGETATYWLELQLSSIDR